MGRLISNPKHKAGYSLVEILVVLMIIGLMTSVAYLSFRPDRDPVQEAASAFQTDLARARTVALTQGRFVGLDVFPGGYRFLTYQDGEWQRLEGIRQLEGRDFSNEITLRLQGAARRNETEEIANWPDYWFDPTGLNEAAVFWFESHEARIRVEVGGLDGIRLVEAS